MVMNYKLFSALTFVAGIAIGATVTWKYVNDKYDLCIKESYDEYEEDEEDTEVYGVTDEVVKKETTDESDIMEYEAKIKKLGYDGSAKKEDEEDMSLEPYVISSEEYDDGEYETETLTLFSDGVLTDWYNNIVEDVEGTVGLDVIENFDKYAEDGDTVFVRNDYLYTDYEIQRDLRNYADVFPELVEE